jgi:hypothetical protein
MSATPPRQVADAASVVNGWLKQQERTVLTPDQISKLSWAERLDYARKFDQSQFQTPDTRRR